jgi:hypothetical protein
MEKGGYLGDGFSRFVLIYEMIGAADRYYGQPRREFVHRRR